MKYPDSIRKAITDVNCSAKFEKRAESQEVTFWRKPFAKWKKKFKIGSTKGEGSLTTQI